MPLPDHAAGKPLGGTVEADVGFVCLPSGACGQRRQDDRLIAAANSQQDSAGFLAAAVGRPVARILGEQRPAHIIRQKNTPKRGQ